MEFPGAHQRVHRSLRGLERPQEGVFLELWGLGKGNIKRGVFFWGDKDPLIPNPIQKPKKILSRIPPFLSGPEPQVMDYVTQQYKLFPELAAAYAFTFAGTYISALYMKTNKEILQGEVDKLPEVMWAISLLGLVPWNTSSGSTRAQKCYFS